MSLQIYHGFRTAATQQEAKTFDTQVCRTLLWARRADSEKRDGNRCIEQSHFRQPTITAILMPQLRRF
jgi:hypothetical protein